MADSRQINELPVANEVNAGDLMLVRQGGFDKQAQAGIVRAGALQASNNLSDVQDAAMARTNLGVSTDGFLQVNNNLDDVADAAMARMNLGIDTSDFLLGDNNLSDLENTATARLNLLAAGLGVGITNDYARGIQDNMRIQSYSETTVALNGANAAVTVDLDASNVFTLTPTVAVTLTFANPAPSGQTSTIYIAITNGGASSTSITWPAMINWPAGTAPTLTEAGTDLLLFITHDGGTTWRGLLSGRDLRAS